MLQTKKPPTDLIGGGLLKFLHREQDYFSITAKGAVADACIPPTGWPIASMV